MCDCIQKLEKHLRDTSLMAYKGRTVESVKIPFLEKSFAGPDFAECFITRASVALEGVMRRATPVIQLNYCPFCGKKYLTGEKKEN